MADDLLRQFYARAARTFAIGHEVSQVLSHFEEKTAVPALARLETELSEWQAEFDAHAAYTASLAEFQAADAIWQHLRSSGTPPEAPSWPQILPNSPVDINMAICGLDSLKHSVTYNQERIARSLGPSDLSSLSKSLNTLRQALDWIKKLLEETPSHSDSPEGADPDTLAELEHIRRLGVNQQGLAMIAFRINQTNRRRELERHRPAPVVPQMTETPVTESSINTDSKKKIRQRQPDNMNVRDLCKLLEQNEAHLKAKTKTHIGIAREFTGEPMKNCPNAKNWLRQACRYRHLWKSH